MYMQPTCGYSQCIFNCVLTSLATIGVILFLDILIYFAYSYLYVEKYYSQDLVVWKDRALEDYGIIVPPGTTGSDWTEIFPPVDQTIVNFVSSDDWMWASSNNGTYVCKQPCDGLTNDSIWRKLNIALDNVSSSPASGVFGISADGKVYQIDKTDGTGAIEQPIDGLSMKQINVGNTNNLWGIDNNYYPRICTSNCSDAEEWKIIDGSLMHITTGNKWTWGITKIGGVLVKRQSDGSGAWSTIKSVPLISISADKDDNLYVITKDRNILRYNALGFSPIVGAPKLDIIMASSKLYGIAKEVSGNRLWTAPLNAI